MARSLVKNRDARVVILFIHHAMLRALLQSIKRLVNPGVFLFIVTDSVANYLHNVSHIDILHGSLVIAPEDIYVQNFTQWFNYLKQVMHSTCNNT